MKQISKIFTVLFFLSAVSCSKEICELSDIGNASHKSNYAISIEDISSYLSDASHSCKTRGESYRVQPVTIKKDTVLYIVNYEQGWEVFSADKRAPRVFAKADTGSITIQDFVAIPPLKCLYDAFVENVCFLKANPHLKPHIDFIDCWDAIKANDQEQSNKLPRTRSGESEVVQNHLLQTKWGQDYPWNIRAPYTDINLYTHCQTGSGPVALAQVLYYYYTYYFPYYLNMTYGIQYVPYLDSYNYVYIQSGNTYTYLLDSDVTFISSYNDPSSIWGSMPLDQYGSGSFAAVATLMTDMGVATQSKYYATETTTNPYNVFTVLLNKCNLTAYLVSVDFDELSDMIIQDYNPAIMLLGYLDSNNWVYNQYVVADAMEELYTDSVLTSRYIGFNWGFDGQYDNLWLNTDAINWSANHIYSGVNCMIYHATLE
jgi:hypothetical protein